jgi:hypothetical protein
LRAVKLLKTPFGAEKAIKKPFNAEQTKPDSTLKYFDIKGEGIPFWLLSMCYILPNGAARL